MKSCAMTNKQVWCSLRDYGAWVRRGMLAIALVSAPRAMAQCQSWEPAIGPPLLALNDSAMAFAVAPDGPGQALYAGGFFYNSMTHVYKWNGTDWSGVGALGGDIYQFSGWDQYVFALSVYDGGQGAELHAGGHFYLYRTDGINLARGIARWTGSTWVPVGDGVSGDVRALAEYSVGGVPSLIVGGSFGTTGSGFNWASRIAAWNGTSWSKLGSNTIGGGFGDGEVHAFEVWDSGQGSELYAGGSFTFADGTPAAGVARWNGTSWSDVGVHSPFFINDFAIFDDGSGPALYAAGGFYLHRWDGTSWTTMNALPNNPIYKLAVFDDGNGPALYVGGRFSQIGGISASGLARFDGTNWSTVGGGTVPQWPALSGQVDGLGVQDDGTSSRLLVGGQFWMVGGTQPSRHIAAWRGCSSPIDTYCFGDGTFMDCPCGNRGALGNGCAWHNGPDGARLAAAGSPNPDTIVLTASGMPAGAPSTTFFKGDQSLNAPVPFGDGLRCINGALIRLGNKTNVGGTAQFPEAGNQSVSIRGGTPPGSGLVAYYQTYYRNAAVFCVGPATYNITNGVRIVW
jgi:hypothetical protein